MKRLLLLTFLLLAITALAGNYFTAAPERKLTITTSGTAVDTAYLYDTLKLNATKATSTLVYRFRQPGPSHTLRGAGLADTAVVVIKSRVQDFWVTIDSFITALPDTTIRWINHADGDTIMFGDLYSIVRITDTATDSAMTISWTYYIEMSGKE